MYYKLVVANITSFFINQQKIRLQQELYERATDPTIAMRRFRMLNQLASYESQIIKKIYEFQSNDMNDYVMAVNQIIAELNHVTDRNG